MRRVIVRLMVVVALLASACGSDDAAVPPSETDGVDDGATAGDAGSPADSDDQGLTEASEPTSTPEPDPDPTPATEPDPAPETEPEPAAQASRPPDEVAAIGETANAPRLPTPNIALDDGWTQTEYTFGGDAVSYRAVGEVSTDGFWTVEQDMVAPYRTRLITRLPPPDLFSGVVLLEWFNVTSGADIAVDWGFMAEEILREGHGYVGVSVQDVSVNGQETQFIEGGLIDTRGLRVQDPERYGDLTHPGDAFAYDIFTQAAAAVAGLGGHDVMGGLEAEWIIGMGQSQSAAFMTGYINTAQPVVGLIDGFLVHSRGGSAPGPAVAERLEAVRIRTDLGTPVLIYEAETDLTILRYAEARQDDTDTVRTWEVAGTAHSDAYTLAVAINITRDGSLGALLGCPAPINDGPHHETVQAAMRHLVTWVRDGTPPPDSPRLSVTPDGEIQRDELGIAVGGVRTPPVDVPLRVLSGDPTTTEGACVLFGKTLDFDAETLATLYPTLGDFKAALAASAASAVDAGWLLPEDAEIMIAEETARAEALGLAGG